jgi:hypothetical protein
VVAIGAAQLAYMRLRIPPSTPPELAAAVVRALRR